MYRYADPIAGRHEAHLRKATRSGVKPARAKEQVNEIAEATQQITKSGRLHLSYNDNNVTISDISVKYVTTQRCAGGLKKKLDLQSSSQRHRHFGGIFNVPVQAPTWATVAFYDMLGIRT